MNYKTGKGNISLVALLGVWSVSALTSLPGLAVSPILANLTHIFTHATDLDIQMLTSLPSLMIIPFVLLSGWFTEHVGYMRLLYWGLWLFLLSGLLYLFCRSMKELILVSALLGVGAGIIIPLSTSLISRLFIGEYRTRQFGYASAITNITLVIATATVGYLADIQWRLPFVVYLLPIFSILLMPAVSRAIKNIDTVAVPDKTISVSSYINYMPLLRYMLYYFLITYLIVAVNVNLPFLMSEYGHDSGSSGLIISLFFLAMMLPGFFLNSIVHFMKKRITAYSLLMIGLGLLIIYLYRSLPLISLGCIISGVGYGIAQPYIYDRTSSVASPNKVSFAMALVMVMNYVAILVAPFLMDLFQKWLNQPSERFPFAFNTLVSFAVFFVLLVYGVKREYK
ncbi:MAG: MFS transporter [Bacteroidaceae bacterium]|nr:MFS transporter [Bacteroidaceae bacterium]